MTGTIQIQTEAGGALSKAKKQIIRVIRRALMMLGRALITIGPRCFAAWPVWLIVGVILVIILLISGLKWWSLFGLLWPAGIMALGLAIYLFGLFLNVILFIIEWTIRIMIFIIKMIIKLLKKATEVAKVVVDDPMPKIKKYEEPEDQIRAIYKVYDEGVGKKVKESFDAVEKQLYDALKDEPETQQFFAQMEAIKSKQMLPGKKYAMLFKMADDFYNSIADASPQ